MKGKAGRRLLVLTTYPASDASARHRVFAFLPTLEAAGWVVTRHSIVSPRLYDLKNRAGWRAQIEKAARLLVGLAARLAILSRTGSYDAVWVHREAFPFFTPFFERLIGRLHHGRFLLDFDDALFVESPGGRDWRRRLRSPAGYRGAIRAADGVVAGSPYLADWASRQGVRAVLVPTCVDVREVIPIDRSARTTVTVGWIGSWSTTPSLLRVASVLREAASDSRVRLLFVGAFDLPYVRRVIPEAEWRTWNSRREASDLAEFDIGIMPVEDSAWNRGKCAFKLIQYMSNGIPYVASPVGMNGDVARASGGGILSSDSEEWLAAIRCLVDDPNLRAELGRAGRQYAEAVFDRRLYDERIAGLLDAG